MFQDDKHVITCPGVVTWDGLTRPETKQNKDGTTAVVHSLRIAIPPNSPEIGELEALAQKELVEGLWKGKLPSGGRMPLSVLGPEDFGASLSGYTTLNSTTYNGAPQVFDVHGKILTPMEYGAGIYPGCKVQLLIHAFSYNNINKGVGFGLDGVRIVDSTAPRLVVSGGVDASKAFGAPLRGAPSVPAPGAPSVPAASTPPPPPAGVVPAPDFLKPPARRMTAKAGGLAYEDFKRNNWTDEQLIAQGYMEDAIPY